MSPAHPEPTTDHGALVVALSHLADAAADTLRLLHRIGLHLRHPAAGPRAAAPPACGAYGPTGRPRAPRRLDATGVDPARARRTHRYRRRR